jgi:hypothetical protein
MFSLTPSSRHPNAAARQRMARMLCVYDNAGELFEPGRDTTHHQGTRHLAQSRVLVFLFDPTQHHKFRQKCQGPLAARPAESGTVRQDVVLLEVAARIRRFMNAPQTTKHAQPLVVLVTKCDAWLHLLDAKAIAQNPWRSTTKQISALDGARLAEISRQLKHLLKETCPELVGAAEGFAEHVTYLPVSSLGQTPQVDSAGRLVVRPRDVKPIWAAVPLIYGFQRSLKGLIPGLKTSLPPYTSAAKAAGSSGVEKGRKQA